MRIPEYDNDDVMATFVSDPAKREHLNILWGQIADCYCEEEQAYEDSLRRERVVEALSGLISPLLSENPHLRISAAEAIQKLHEETGMARSLILGDLRAASDDNISIDGDNTVMRFVLDSGEAFFEAQPVENPIQPLDK